MLKHISEDMKKTILTELYKKYDKINRILQRDFLRTHYEKWEIVDMELELKYIDLLIQGLKEE